MRGRGRPRHPNILTPREWEVLSLLREGLSNEGIAERLGVTLSTARFHVSEILGKLGVTSRDEAAKWRPAPDREIGSRLGAGVIFAMFRRLGAPTLAAGTIAASTLIVVLLAWGVVTSLGDRSASPQAQDLAPSALAFSAGGAIYAVDAAGDAPRMLVAGDREAAWASAPALSPDGETLLFARGLDIWSATADGSNPRLLADVADLVTPPANSASNPSLGAQDVAFSLDGSLAAYVRARIGGSGDSELWTMRPDGSDRRKLYTTGSFISPVWQKATFIAIDEGDRIVDVATDATLSPDAALPPESRFGQRATPMRNNLWLVGSILTEQPIMVGQISGPSIGMSQIGAGVSPTLSPDGQWVAYFWHDTLRVVNVDGSGDHLIADLGPLGGRDHHFSEQPDCYPQALPACSYRPPSVAWFPNADTKAFTAATPTGQVPLDATPLVEVSGLFSEPRLARVDEERSLGPKPSAFASWDGKSTMLYDTQAGTETNLGLGTLGHFSPSGTKMVWIANPQDSLFNGEAWLLDIGTGVKRDLGPGRLANLVDDDHVAIAYPSSNDSYVVDLQTGARHDQPGLIGTLPQVDERTPDGFVLSRQGESLFSLIDPSTSRVLLRFSAQNIVAAGRGGILVATSTMDANGSPAGGVNLFLVDIATGQATFVVTTTPDAAYTANEKYVLWTDSYCTAAPGRTRLLSRATGRITELDGSLVPRFIPNGLILDGSFNGSALIDPTTLQYVSVIPARGDSSWSRDYRYASLGQFGGHGGCAG